MDHEDKSVDLTSDEKILLEWQSPYIEAATSDNTRIAYQKDIRDFVKRGGVLPATPEIVEQYLRDCAGDINPRTLKRRLTALRQWHRLQNETDPTDNPLVIKTLKGISRLHGKPKRQAAALRLKDLDKIVSFLKQSESKLNIRNQALLLLGYFGAFRRSELVSLTWEQVCFVSDGVTVLLPRSKTDQAGEGAQCIIPFGDKNRCPVRALIDWRKVSDQWEGYIFRRLSKTGTVLADAIAAATWNRIIRELARNAGLSNADQITSHSLRRGVATEAARKGASMAAIQRHGRWRSTKMVIEYIEDGRQFEDSAVKVLFEY